MNNLQIRNAITQRMLDFQGIEPKRVDHPNQQFRFSVPDTGLWCRLHIDYGGSFMVGVADRPCVRRTGSVVIQCFQRARRETVDLVRLVDAIEEHFAFHRVDRLELLEASIITVGNPHVRGAPGHYYQVNVVIPYRTV